MGGGSTPKHPSFPPPPPPKKGEKEGRGREGEKRQRWLIFGSCHQEHKKYHDTSQLSAMPTSTPNDNFWMKPWLDIQCHTSRVSHMINIIISVKLGSWTPSVIHLCLRTLLQLKYVAWNISVIKELIERCQIMKFVQYTDRILINHKHLIFEELKFHGKLLTKFSNKLRSFIRVWVHDSEVKNFRWIISWIVHKI